MSQPPPFCPNKACANHRAPQGNRWYRPFGYYRTKAYGWVKRFACVACGKSFSEQTFNLSYYLHLTISFRDILFRLSSCLGLRAMARLYGVTDKVITNRVGRLARQAIGTMAGLRPFQKRSEALVADGFESFIGPPFCPINIHHLVGASSQYIHACDFAHSGEFGASFERICHALRDLAGERDRLILHTDGKREYRAVLEANDYLEGRVRHLTASPRKARTHRNPLRQVNDNDRELGKDLAAQVRETTRWSRETNDCMERTYAYAGYHNYFKPFRIKSRDSRTHAETAGFDVEKIRSFQGKFFRKRFFYSKVSFNISEWLVWLRGYHTPFRSGFRELPAYVTGAERRRAVPCAA